MKVKPPKNIADKTIEKGTEASGAIGGAVAGGATGALIGGAGAILSGGTLTPAIKAGVKAGADIGANIGKESGKLASKAGMASKKIREVANDPLNWIINNFLKAIIDILIPIPVLGEYAGDLFIKYKGQIFFVLFGVFIMIFSLVAGSFTNTFNGTKAYASHISELPEELKGYKEAGFTSQSKPNKSPLGGDCLEYSIITSYFNDINYYLKFGRWHKALDIIPSNTYYTSNKAYKLTGEIVMFATIDGDVIFGIDDSGANIVAIRNNNKTTEVGYAHLKTSYVKTGDYVNTGDPIGVMGSTGKSTGIHVHYWVAEMECPTCWPEAIDPYPLTFGWCV